MSAMVRTDGVDSRIDRVCRTGLRALEVSIGEDGARGKVLGDGMGKKVVEDGENEEDEEDEEGEDGEVVNDRVSSVDALGQRAEKLKICTHNTGVLRRKEPQENDGDIRKLRDRVARFLKKVADEQDVVVEIDRLALLGTPCNKIVHFLDSVLQVSDLIDLLKDMSDRGCNLIILFDFKNALMPTKKTTHCVPEWEAMLKKAGVKYKLRPIGMVTVKASKCSERRASATDVDLKTYVDKKSSIQSPAYALFSCMSSMPAFDVWSTSPRDVLIRTCLTSTDGKVREQQVDYKIITVSVEAYTGILAVAYMEITADGSPHQTLTQLGATSIKWRAFKSLSAFCVIDTNGIWHGTRHAADEEKFIHDPVLTKSEVEMFEFNYDESSHTIFVDYLQR